jgi:hypothetical protein
MNARLAWLVLALAACGQSSSSADHGETCNQIEQRSGPALVAAIDRASADLSCQKDDDCVLASNDTDCHLACGVVLNRKGQASLAAAIVHINADVCAGFVAMKCPRIAPPCVPPVGEVACVSGACAYRR